MNDNFELEHIARKLRYLEQPSEKNNFIQKLESKQIKQIVQLWKKLVNRGCLDEEYELVTFSLKYIIQYRAKECLSLKNLAKSEILNVIKMFQQKDIDLIMSIIAALHFEIGCEQVTRNEDLFRLLIKNFQFIEEDEVRQAVTRLLVDLMSINNQFIKFANQPYYFMEYLLYKVNQEEDQEKLIVWLEHLQKIYLSPNSEDILTENDFKILVDVLVRNIQNFTDEKKLAKYLETYLILSIFPFMRQKDKYYKIDQIILVLAELQEKSEQIEGLTGQIASLKHQSL